MFQGNALVPRQIFFTTGVGMHQEKLTSFEMALRHAQIARYNLVRISSILPPHCEFVERKDGVKGLQAGEIVFCVLSKASSNEPGNKLGASVGVAVPKDRSMYGYIAEHQGFGQSASGVGEHAEDLAAQMLATALGISFDPEAARSERRNRRRLSGHAVESRSYEMVSEVPDQGFWTTVVAAAVVCG